MKGLKFKSRWKRRSAKMAVPKNVDLDLVFAACERVFDRRGSAYQSHWSYSSIPELELRFASGKLRGEARAFRFVQNALAGLLVFPIVWCSVTFSQTFYEEVVRRGPQPWVHKVFDVQSEWFVVLARSIAHVWQLISFVPAPVMLYLVPCAAMAIWIAWDRHRVLSDFSSRMRKLAKVTASANPKPASAHQDEVHARIPDRILRRDSFSLTFLVPRIGSTQEDRSRLLSALAELGLKTGRLQSIGYLCRVPLLNAAPTVNIAWGQHHHQIEIFRQGEDGHILWSGLAAIIQLIAAVLFVAYAIIPLFIPIGRGSFSGSVAAPLTEFFLFPLWAIGFTVSPLLGRVMAKTMTKRAARQAKLMARNLQFAWSRSVD